MEIKTDFFLIKFIDCKIEKQFKKNNQKKMC